MEKAKIQINCDLGEGVENEAQIIPLIDAASIACGGHFGDQSTIAHTLSLCEKFGKAAGAHPSYPDMENFGRKSIDISDEYLIDALASQLELFESVRQNTRLELDHIKFHGALYNDAAKDSRLAELLCHFLIENLPETTVFVPPGSEMEKAAKLAGLAIKREIFGDRTYGEDLKLRPRSEADSLLTKYDSVEKHLEPILNSGKIQTVNGTMSSVPADTLCFHGDNPGLLNFLPKIRKKWWN